MLDFAYSQYSKFQYSNKAPFIKDLVIAGAYEKVFARITKVVARSDLKYFQGVLNIICLGWLKVPTPEGMVKKVLSKYDSKYLQGLIKSGWVHIHFHQNMCVFAQRRCLSFLDEKFLEWRISWMKNFLGKVWNLHRGYFIMCKFQPSWHCTHGLLLLVMTAAVAKFCKFSELHFYWEPVMRLLGCNLLLSEHFSYWVNIFLIFY